MLFHDDTLERCTGVHGFIPDMTLAELQQLNYITEISQPSRYGVVTFTYDKPRPIALLEDVLKMFAAYGGRKVIDVEIKASRPMWSRRHWGTAVAQLLKKYNAADWVVVTSFDFIMLYYAAREYPQLRTGFAYDDDIAVGLDECAREWFEKVPTIRDGRLEPPAGIKNGGGLLRWLMEANVIGWAFNCSAAIFEWTVLDSDTVEKFRHRDYAVGTYTIFALDKSFSHFDLTDSETHILIRNLLAQRVDWIETDEPAKLLALIKQVEQETLSSAVAESAAGSNAAPAIAANGHADSSETPAGHSAAAPEESSKQPASSDDIAAATDGDTETALD